MASASGLTNDTATKFASEAVLTDYLIMAWDAKRQFIWLATGIGVGSFIVYLDAHDDNGAFVPSFFIFMEVLLLLIISVMFYIYSRRKE